MAESKSPAYRWVIEALLFLALFGQALTWLAPAPLLQPIIKDLQLSLGSAGLIISVIALCISIFSFLGAFVAERLGALRAMLVGIWLLGLGAILSGYSRSFSALLVCRVIEGIGFGVMISPPGTLVMQWFGEKEWPYINMVNAFCSYIGLTAVFSLTPAIFAALGSSWRAVLRDYGVAVAVVALGWTILGRERHLGGIAAPEAGANRQRESALGEVIRMRNVMLLAIGLFGGMWVFQLYTAFLPEFFQTYRGMTLSEASKMTAVLPLTGIFAALGGGIGTGVMGLRKPFLWPVAILTLAGCIGVITLPGAGAARMSLVLVGIGSAGSLTAIITLLMELPGMTPAKMGSGLAFIWAVGYAGAFVSPFLGGALAGLIGLRAVMLAFLALQALPIVCMYMIPETGPGRARIAIATAA
jgi:CP family cyanate transporter-like MFS transporter